MHVRLCVQLWFSPHLFFLFLLSWNPSSSKHPDLPSLSHTGLFQTSIDIEYSGTTGVVVYLEANHLWCFNVGDSRAVLAQRTGDEFSVVPLSRDHKPEDTEEKSRIEGQGGRCEPKMTVKGPVGSARVWLKDQNIPGLAVARAFGDKIAATIGVIAEPEVKERELKEEEDMMVVLASDGVWEFMENLDVVAWAAEVRKETRETQETTKNRAENTNNNKKRGERTPPSRRHVCSPCILPSRPPPHHHHHHHLHRHRHHHYACYICVKIGRRRCECLQGPGGAE